VGVLTAILNTLIVIMSLFLICLVLIQRGRGGGLAGAFGGTGGSSAFGTKAGDTFTRVTIVTASIWILMTMLLVVLTNTRRSSVFDDAPTSAAPESSAAPSPDSAVPPAPIPAEGGATPSAESAPAPVDRVPAIPETSTFPLTPGNAPPPKAE